MPSQKPKLTIRAQLKNYKYHIFLGVIVLFVLINSLYVLFLFSTVQRIDAESTLGSTQTSTIPSYPELQEFEHPEISARSSIVYDPESRVVVYGTNEYLRFTPASATKIMTALVSLETYENTTVLTAINPELVEGSKMNLYNGEQITVENVLYGLLLPSGNDAAYVLAQQYPGGLPSFVDEMNRKARELKLENTYFEDPSGFSDNNYTTSYDLARLAAYAMHNPKFRDIVGTRAITVYNTDYTVSHYLENLNELLYEEGINGVKTGFTNEAGGVLVTSIQSNGKSYIVVILKSNDRFYDTRQLIREIVQKVDVVNYSQMLSSLQEQKP